MILVVLLTLPTVSLAGPRRTVSAEALYEQGLRQMRRGYFTKALESFNRVRNYHRDDPLSVLAQLAIADLHFKKKDFEQARFAYEEFASLHPRHKSLDFVTWRIGLSIYKRASRMAGRDQSATRAAVNVWTGFDTRFPESEHVSDVDRLLTKARNRLANKELFVAKFYERKDAWGAVRGRTEYMLRRYPDTQSVPEALQLLGTAMHAWGDTDEALQVRERLAQAHPESIALKRLDRAMSGAPGVRPDEKVFVRPYRIRGALPPQQTGGGPSQ
ncbi:MAG: outer membrane protein assembly factor BamD [Myxococcales bacterium]|nr:outer membrane protein assembly factor BamD [Myxococcales bacterium]